MCHWLSNNLNTLYVLLSHTYWIAQNLVSVLTDGMPVKEKKEAPHLTLKVDHSQLRSAIQKVEENRNVGASAARTARFWTNESGCY